MFSVNRFDTDIFLGANIQKKKKTNYISVYSRNRRGASAKNTIFRASLFTNDVDYNDFVPVKHYIRSYLDVTTNRITVKTNK